MTPDAKQLVTFRETRTQKTGDLLDQGFRGQECIVLLSEFFDKLLVLVEPGEMKSDISEGGA